MMMLGNSYVLVRRGIDANSCSSVISIGALAPTVWTRLDRVRADGGAGRGLGRRGHAGLCQFNQSDLLQGVFGSGASERQLAEPRRSASLHSGIRPALDAIIETDQSKRCFGFGLTREIKVA